MAVTKIEVKTRPYGAVIEIETEAGVSYRVTVNDGAGSLIVNGCGDSLLIKPHASNEVIVKKEP